MKALGILSLFISIVSLIITILMWSNVNLPSKILFIIAVLAASLLTYMIFNYWYLKKSIPKLIHMKGLCAHTHELRNLVSNIPKGLLKDEKVWSIVQPLITSAHSRSTFLAAGNPALENVREELLEAANDDCNEEVVRRNIGHIYKIVDETDVSLLRKVGVHDIVYPA